MLRRIFTPAFTRCSSSYLFKRNFSPKVRNFPTIKWDFLDEEDEAAGVEELRQIAEGDQGATERDVEINDKEAEDQAFEDAAFFEGYSEARAAEKNHVVGLVRGGEFLTVDDMGNLEKDITESYVRGSGKGGQSVNKTSNCVVLKHKPTGIVVKCHATRSLEQNRKRARAILQERLELIYLGEEAAQNKTKNKIRKKKSRRKRKYSHKVGKRKEKEPLELNIVADVGPGNSNTNQAI